jgi:hypothetical protein
VQDVGIGRARYRFAVTYPGCPLPFGFITSTAQAANSYHVKGYIGIHPNAALCGIFRAPVTHFTGDGHPFLYPTYRPLEAFTAASSDALHQMHSDCSRNPLNLLSAGEINGAYQSAPCGTEAAMTSSSYYNAVRQRGFYRRRVHLRASALFPEPDYGGAEPALCV